MNFSTAHFFSRQKAEAEKKAKQEVEEKSEVKKETKEQYVTEADLFAAFRGGSAGGFVNRIGFHRDERMDDDFPAPQKTSDAAEIEKPVETTQEQKTEVIETETQIAPQEIAPQEEAQEETQTDDEKRAALLARSPFYLETGREKESVQLEVEEKRAQAKKEIEKPKEKPKKELAKKVEVEKVAPQPQVENKVVSEIKLDEKELQLFEKLTKALEENEEAKFCAAVEEIAKYRAQDEDRCKNDAPLNLAIRQRVVQSISTQLAYASGREIMRGLQLLDMLNLEIETGELTKLPETILRAEELKKISYKYLLWCAKEYAHSPNDLVRKILVFVHAGIFEFDEICRDKQIVTTLENALLAVVKENIKSPLEVERKIYQYSLTGLIDGAAFRQTEKLKDVAQKFILELLEKHKDRPEEIAKKIKDFEHTKLLTTKEIRENKKVQALVEKYLTKYAKLNHEHPRKISMRVREYFDIGLIDKEMKDKFVK